jgi:hypothetical protein
MIKYRQRKDSLNLTGGGLAAWAASKYLIMLFANISLLPIQQYIIITEPPTVVKEILSRG